MIRREDYILKLPVRATLPPGRSLALRDRVRWMISRIHKGKFKGDSNMSQITGAQADRIRTVTTDWVKAQIEADRLRQNDIGPWVKEPCPLVDRTDKAHPILYAIENDYSVHDCFNDFIQLGRKPFGMKFYDAQIFEKYFAHSYREQHFKAGSSSGPSRAEPEIPKPKPLLNSKSELNVKREKPKKVPVDMVQWAELQNHTSLLSGALSFLIPWLDLMYRVKKGPQYCPNSCVIWAKKSAALIVLAFLYYKMKSGFERTFTQDEIDALLRPCGVPAKFSKKNKALMALSLCNVTRLGSFCTSTNAAVCLQNSKEETKFKHDGEKELKKQPDAKKTGLAYANFKKAIASFKESSL